jgi:murein DD-endopeptidase MepM/ murein hydrolase activator NlpD
MRIRFLIATSMALSVVLLLSAAENATETLAQGKKPFSLPFAGAPGPSTWVWTQPYGNTTFAYVQRKDSYAMGQGIHFGIDLGAGCGTPVLAIGDGVVFGSDGPWGSGPHNLLIDHPNGYASLYGHLLQRPQLPKGTRVKKGQPIALSGDPDLTCYSRPHLHLEIRDPSHTHWYNPVLLIEADWDSIVLSGAFGRGFERDLDNPRQWQSIYDQPEADGGAPLLNDFAHPWPPAPSGR